MPISQVGIWKVNNTTAVSFDATPVANQQLTVRITLTNSTSDPTWTTPTGWNQRLLVQITSGGNRTWLIWLDRIAAGVGGTGGDGVAANDTFTMATNATGHGWESARWTGHDLTTPFQQASVGATNAGLNAQTTTDADMTATAEGLAIAAVAFRTSTQSVTSWGTSGFTTSETHTTIASGGAVATKAVAEDDDVHAQVVSGGPSSGSVATVIGTVIYNVDGFSPPSGTTPEANIAGVLTAGTLKANVAGVLTAGTPKVNVAGVLT